MKQNHGKANVSRTSLKVIAILVLMLGVISILVSMGLYAYAKYISTNQGTATADIARWNFTVTGSGTTQSGDVVFALTRTDNNTDVESGTIAPGTYGSLPITINTTGTEVDLTYDIVVTITNCPQNVTFTPQTPASTIITRSGTGTEQDPRIATIRISKYIPHATTAANRVHNETINWNWLFETGSTQSEIDENDIIDTQDLGKTATVNVSVTGTQVLEQPTSTLADADVPKNVTVEKDGTAQIQIKSFYPMEDVTYLSNDTNCATVDNDGTVTGVAIGTTTITVAGSNNVTKTINLNVVKKPLQIGDSVAYSTTLNNVPLENWKVFYKDGNYTYIIYGDYLPCTAVDTSKLTGIITSNTYTVKSSVNRETFINAMTTKSNWIDLINNGKIDGKALSSEVTSDINVWSIGSPTLDLWVKSWNAKYPNDTAYTRYEASVDGEGFDGWYIGSEENPTTGKLTVSKMAGFNQEVYLPHKDKLDGCKGYWIASPSYYGKEWLMCVHRDGRIYYGKYSNAYYAFRPVIRLPSSILE